jgi:hypothetical protein
MKLINIATEDLVKHTQKEVEVVIYAKITNPEGLAEAYSVEQHEQAQVKTSKGSVRIRKITTEGKEPYFEMTSKQKLQDDKAQSSIETTKRISSDVYELFLTVCENYMSKTRYIFKAETINVKVGDMTAQIKAKDMNYEVDVFSRADGNQSEWCKIDLEIDNLRNLLEENNLNIEDIKLIASIGKLPFKPNHVVIDDGSDEDPDKRALITALYQNEFLIKR